MVRFHQRLRTLSSGPRDSRARAGCRFAPRVADVSQFFAASKTTYNPTLVVGYGGIWGENYWCQHTDIGANKRDVACHKPSPPPGIWTRIDRGKSLNGDEPGWRSAPGCVGERGAAQAVEQGVHADVERLRSLVLFPPHEPGVVSVSAS